MGVVYLAEDPRLHRPVALKTMSPSVAGDPELLQRFYREAESAGQLRHPNIVTIYDIDEAEGTPFIAMEFLEGDSLEKLIRIRKPLPSARPRASPRSSRASAATRWSRASAAPAWSGSSAAARASPAR